MKKHIDFENGDRYFGEVNAKGQPHGQGNMDYKLNGYYGEYEGEWRDGKRCGKGRYYQFSKGGGASHIYEYKGEWLDDKENGQGIAINSDERGLHLSTITTKYEGGFKDGKRHGHGKIEKDGYDGSFAYGKEYFEGEFVEGKLAGHCIHKMVNGDVCEWENGYCSGIGTYTFANGVKFTALWQNGNLDFDTIELEGGKKALLLMVAESTHGFDYSHSIRCLIIAKKGVQPYNEAMILYNDDFHINSESANIEIKDVTDDSVTYVVKSKFLDVKNDIVETIKRGETKNYKDERRCTATIYDEDYDYTTGNQLIVSCK